MSPDLYRLCFGVHAFVPLMSFMQVYVIGFVYGWLGYWVFNFLFSWRDLNWEKRLRGRFFQFSPVQVSAECMRWWLERGIHAYVSPFNEKMGSFSIDVYCQIPL